MGKRTDYSISGGKEAAEKIDQYGSIIGNAAMRRSIRAAALVLKQAIEAAAPKDMKPDNLHINESFKIRVTAQSKKFRKASGKTNWVSARVYSSYNDVSKYIFATEFGRRAFWQRKRPKGLKGRPFHARMPAILPNPFARDTFRSLAPSLSQKLTDDVTNEVQSLAKKQGATP